MTAPLRASVSIQQLQSHPFESDPRLTRHRIHVAHVIVDGLVDMPVINRVMPDAPKEQLLEADAIAESFLMLHSQPPQCEQLPPACYPPQHGMAESASALSYRLHL